MQKRHRPGGVTVAGVAGMQVGATAAWDGVMAAGVTAAGVRAAGAMAGTTAVGVMSAGAMAAGITAGTIFGTTGDRGFATPPTSPCRALRCYLQFRCYTL